MEEIALLTDHRSDTPEVAQRLRWRLSRVGSCTLLSCAIALTCLSQALAQGPVSCLDALEQRVKSMMVERAFEQALHLAGEMASESARRFPANHVCRARALQFQGTLLQLVGNHPASGAALEQALAIYRKALSDDDPELTLTLNNLGMQRFWMRQYEDAARLHEEAYQARSRRVPRDELAIADSLHNLADAYRYLEREPRVVAALYIQALDIRRRLLAAHDTRIAVSLQNLASAQELQGDLDAAAKNIEAAIAVYEKAEPRADTLLAAAYNRLGTLLFMAGDLALAERQFRNALQAHRQQVRPHLLTLAATLDDFALNQMEQGKNEEAGSLLDEALKVRTETLPPSHPTISRTLSNMAELERRRGRRDLALPLIRRANEILIARDRADERSRFQYFRQIAMLWEARGLQQTSADVTLIDEAFVLAQRTTRTAAASALSRMTARFSASEPRLRDLLRQIDDLEHERAAIENTTVQTFSLPAEEGREALSAMRARAQAIEARLSELSSDIARGFPGYQRLVRPAPLSIAQAQQLLAPGEVMVKIVSGELDTWVFALTREQSSWHKVSMPADEIVKAVASLRGALDIEDLKASVSGANTGLFDLGLAYRLYAALIEPARALVKGKQHIILVASGPMMSLPLQVLVVSSPKVTRPTLKQLALYRSADWLVRHHAVSVLPAVESLAGLRHRQIASGAARKALIGFGNPVFDPSAAQRSDNGVSRARVNSDFKSRGYSAFWRGGSPDRDALRQLPALPDTEAELKSVARHLGVGQSDLLLGADATETAVKAHDLAAYRVVYFATHGLVAGEIKGLGEAALALSPPDRAREVDDGLLTSSEVAQLKLDADWVVLSACNTAAGDGTGAEALSGLARAFFHAGARALLVSHWRVGSEATAHLISTTFQKLQSSPTVSRAEALRRAMLEYQSRAGDPWSAYPGFWAAFSVVGDSGR